MSSPVRDGFQRLKDLLDEMARIAQKRGLAAQHGASELALRRLDEEIAGLAVKLGEAAVAEAKRELEDATDEARRLANGKPPANRGNPHGPGSPTPPDPPKPPNGGGSEGGAGPHGDPGFFGIPQAPPPQGGSNNVPPAECIFVRSADSVWAWNRFEQQWKEQAFTSRLLKVDRIGGGLLAVAEHQAAIFDASLGRWLTTLTTGETLIEGRGDFASGVPASPPVPTAPPVATSPAAIPTANTPVVEPVASEPPLDFPDPPLTTPDPSSSGGPGL